MSDPPPDSCRAATKIAANFINLTSVRGRSAWGEVMSHGGHDTIAILRVCVELNGEDLWCHSNKIEIE